MLDPRTFWKSPAAIAIAPNTLTNRQLLGKTGLWLLIGIMIAFLLFLLLSFLGSIFTDALQASDFITPSPLLPLFMLFIGFLITVIGNMIVAALYNLFYSNIYYDATKMIALLLLTNGILFMILAPIYVAFFNQSETLFLILGFHILFSIFLSSNQIEFFANPNYAASNIIGNTCGFALSILIYGLIYKSSVAYSSQTAQQSVYLLMLFPSILWFSLTPLSLGIWQKIYFKFYELGNNGFYIPSLAEVISEEPQIDEDGETNVE